MSIPELKSNFPANHLPTLRKIIKAIPNSWKASLHSPNFTSFFQSYPYVIHTKSSNPTIFQVIKYFDNEGFAFCTPCVYNKTDHTISPSHEPAIGIRTQEALPILTLNNQFVAPISSPNSLLLRFPSLACSHTPSFHSIMNSLKTHPQLPFQDKWNTILPNINWNETFKLRRASFIPPKEKDILLRIQCNTLPTAARLHSKHIPIICDYCDEGTIVPNPPLTSNPQSSPTSHPPPIPPPEKIETLHHLLFTCPSSQYIRSSLIRTLDLHLKLKISHPAEILFPPLRNLGHAFPYMLLMATAFRQLWLTRCNRRFESKLKHPKAILHTILHLFLIYMQSQLHSLRKSCNKKSHSRLSSYIKAAVNSKIIIVNANNSITVHPYFKRNWLSLTPFEPP